MVANLRTRERDKVIFVYNSQIYYTSSTFLVGKDSFGNSLRLELDDSDENKGKPLHTKEGVYIRMISPNIITQEELKMLLKSRNFLKGIKVDKSNGAGTIFVSNYGQVSVKELNQMFKEENTSVSLQYSSRNQETTLRFTNKTFKGIHRISKNLIVLKLNEDKIVLKVVNLTD